MLDMTTAEKIEKLEGDWNAAVELFSPILDFARLEFSNRMIRTLGRAWVNRNTKRHLIKLSIPYIALNTYEEMLDTLLHEIAHVLSDVRNKKRTCHGPEWKAVCREIGCRPEVYASAHIKMPRRGQPAWVRRLKKLHGVKV